MIYESLTLSALREEWEQEGDERKREKEAASSNNGFGFGFGFEFGLLEFGHLLSCLSKGVFPRGGRWAKSAHEPARLARS